VYKDGLKSLFWLHLGSPRLHLRSPQIFYGVRLFLWGQIFLWWPIFLKHKFLLVENDHGSIFAITTDFFIATTDRVKIFCDIQIFNAEIFVRRQWLRINVHGVSIFIGVDGLLFKLIWIFFRIDLSLLLLKINIDPLSETTNQLVSIFFNFYFIIQFNCLFLYTYIFFWAIPL
jgi:hypothetical protein